MYRKKKKNGSEEVTYWLSYSDMMAALLLVFVLIISSTMLQAKKQYEDKEKQLQEQQDQLEQQQLIMEIQQEKLDKVIGVRSDLAAALREEFDGSDLKVYVDPSTGAITLDSSILFDVDKYDIKPSGQAFLQDFLPRYVGVLLKPEFNEYISEIIIEGHTDTDGDYMHNLELSQQRALSVARLCVMDNSTVLSTKELEKVRPILTANGRSYSDPIYDEFGNVDMAASRRVEFKFRLTDEEMIDEMMQIMSDE
ncbi:OmpA/MotB family protein [Butyrivibrio fibrisolvens]|uniref:OmpA/MotB family protein n=1 Tax=Butyrivibrio fibrisolvens TaxID=831 RepID=UPI0004082288|nr:OmpA family protein [Butyrivibrio fibrisolvens]